MLARMNRSGCKADDVTIFANRFITTDLSGCYLMAVGNRTAANEAAFDRRASWNAPQSQDDIVMRVELDGCWFGMSHFQRTPL